MPRTPAGDALTALILEIFRVNGDLLDAGDSLVADLGQTASRWQVVGAIRNTQDTVSGIARTMGLARQSVQRTVDILAGEGLVEYVDNPAHRRAKLVRLTDKGVTLLRDIAPRQNAWVDGLVNAIKAKTSEIEAAHDLIARLRAELERSRNAQADVTTSRRNGRR
jgi:DNA-binding MarR family transcriptional regulator